MFYTSQRVCRNLEVLSFSLGIIYPEKKTKLFHSGTNFTLLGFYALHVYIVLLSSRLSSRFWKDGYRLLSIAKHVWRNSLRSYFQSIEVNCSRDMASSWRAFVAFLYALYICEKPSFCTLHYILLLSRDNFLPITIVLLILGTVVISNAFRVILVN